MLRSVRDGSDEPKGDRAQLKSLLQERGNDAIDFLGGHSVQAPQMRRKLLVDKTNLERIGSSRQRGYRFSGALTIEPLIGGDSTVPDAPGKVVRFPPSQGIPTEIPT